MLRIFLTTSMILDAVLIDNLKEKTRYVKVAFDALENVYMDEIFVNPSIR